MRLLLLCVVIIAAAAAATKDCTKTIRSAGLSKNFNETIAHAIHSMTVQGLQIFKTSATENNNIPTVSHDINRKNGAKVSAYAPNDPIGTAFKTDTMNRIHKILSNLGKSTDGLGENWSPIERVVHTFHMVDLWSKINEVYSIMNDPPTEVCRCLLDTKTNGIYKAVEWVANHYETGTPITLLDRPIPKLRNARSWSVWKDRLLYYYKPEALKDAASYLKCVTMAMK